MQKTVRRAAVDPEHTAGRPLDNRVDVNHRYLLHYTTSLARHRGPLRVLDFGCGSGLQVRLLRGAGIDCVGADVFYGGAEWSDPELAQLIDEGIVRRIPSNGRVPFDDDAFDLILTDQVLEHVEDLEGVMAELDRVLRPTGVMYHHFPTLETLREAHIGIPFAHRFPRGKVRWLYTVALRALGLGTYKDGIQRVAWAKRGLDWIDRYCHYRRLSDILALVESGYRVSHREIDYCRFRARHGSLIARMLEPRSLEDLYQRLFRRIGFVAIELTKLPSPASRRE